MRLQEQCVTAPTACLSALIFSHTSLGNNSCSTVRSGWGGACNEPGKNWPIDTEHSPLWHLGGLMGGGKLGWVFNMMPMMFWVDMESSLKKSKSRIMCVISPDLSFWQQQDFMGKRQILGWEQGTYQWACMPESKDLLKTKQKQSWGCQRDPGLHGKISDGQSWNRLSNKTE